jgi:hypothetical protein
MSISGMIGRFKKNMQKSEIREHKAEMKSLTAKRKELGQKAQRTAELRKVKQDIQNIKAYDYKGSRREKIALALKAGAVKIREAKARNDKLKAKGESDGDRARAAIFGGGSTIKQGKAKGESDGDRARRAIFGK